MSGYFHEEAKMQYRETLETGGNSARVDVISQR